MPFGGALSAGIGAGTSLLGGIFGGKAAEKAAKIQQQNAQNVANLATNAANTASSGVNTATTTGTTNVANATGAGLQAIATGTGAAANTLTGAQGQILGLYQPEINAGTAALSSALPTLQQLTSTSGPLSKQFSFNPNDLSSNPGYQFTLQQGQQAIQRAAAAQGNLFSGGTLKSLANYTTGAANQYFNTAYNQALSTYQANQQNALSQIGSLQGLAGLGTNLAESGTAGAAGGVGSTASQLASTLYGGGANAAQFGLSGTGLGANLGLQGAATAGQFGLTGAQIAGNALTGGANAAAAGTVGATNSWLNALNSGTNSTLQYLTMNNPGYGAPYSGAPAGAASLIGALGIPA